MQWLKASGLEKCIVVDYEDENLKAMYQPGDGNTEVYYLKDATAQICSFTGAPVVIKF